MAVYTQIGEEELAAFIAGYDLGPVLACKGIAEGVENSNFLLLTASAPYILTVYEKRVRPEDLPFFLGLMEHLAARGVPCPLPVPGRDGVALRTLAGRPAAIVTFLSGLALRRPEAVHCRAVGEALARLHLAALDYPEPRDNDLSLAGWQRLLDACLAARGEVSADLATELTAELAALTAAWPRGLPAGVIHADLFPDNVLFSGDEVSGLIDFYFACADILAYDVAIMLNAWCFEVDGAFNVTKARALIRGYTSIRPLSGVETAALPVLARGAALRFLLTRLFDWLHTPRSALVTPKNPTEYLSRLRFHRRVRGPAGYGVDDG